MFGGHGCFCKNTKEQRAKHKAVEVVCGELLDEETRRCCGQRHSL
jgi:hypothetical protein